MGRKRMYEPYGYREQDFYVSKVTQLDNELAENKKNDEKEFQDISQLISDVSYDSTINSMVFKNLSGDTLSVFNLADIIASQLIKEAYYDSEAKEIVIVFDDGDEVRINVDDIVNIAMAGDGLEVVSGESGEYFNVKIDEESETDYDGNDFLTVSAEGVKIDGIKDAIESKVAEEEMRAETAEDELSDAIQAEAAARESGDSSIMQYINMLDADLSASTAHVTVGVVQDNGKVTALTLAEEDVASASDLQAEITRAKDKESSLTSAVGANTSNIELLSQKLDLEKAQREAADQELSDRIDEIVTSGSTAELEARVAALEAFVRTHFNETGDGIEVNGNLYIEVEGDMHCLNEITAPLTNEEYDNILP